MEKLWLLVTVSPLKKGKRKIRVNLLVNYLLFVPSGCRSEVLNRKSLALLYVCLTCHLGITGPGTVVTPTDNEHPKCKHDTGFRQNVPICLLMAFAESSETEMDQISISKYLSKRCKHYITRHTTLDWWQIERMWGHQLPGQLYWYLA